MSDRTETPLAVEQLGQMFGGAAIGYHIVRCRNGGYVLVAQGAMHSAHTTLAEAVATMGQVAANEYGESAEPPERALDVTHGPHEDVGDEPLPDGGPRLVRPPEPQEEPAAANGADWQGRARATMTLMLAVAVVGLRGLVGV